MAPRDENWGRPGGEASVNRRGSRGCGLATLREAFKCPFGRAACYSTYDHLSHLSIDISIFLVACPTVSFLLGTASPRSTVMGIDWERANRISARLQAMNSSLDALEKLQKASKSLAKAV